MSISDKQLKAMKITEKLEKNPDGFADNSDTYPFRQYTGRQSTNLEARGIEENTLPYGGGTIGTNLEFKDFASSEYPYNQVRRTVSGHVQEYDDTPGRERILFKHRKGTGIEMQPDGTILIYSTKNTVRIGAGDEKIIIEGDGDITYHGNVKMRVDGDFDLSVGGSYNVDVFGDHEEDIKGGYRQDIGKNVQSLVGGNYYRQVIKSTTNLTHGGDNTFIKGAASTMYGSTTEFLSKGIMTHTSEAEAVLSAPSINIGANDLTAIGATGTMGGDGMVIYANTTHSDRVNSTSMHATTFHGDLNGVADKADEANKAGTAALGAAGSGGTPTVTTATNKETAEPTSSILTSYLGESEFAVRTVTIDQGNVLFNQVNRNADYEGVSDRTLSTTEARSKLRDPLNQKKTKFVGTLIAEDTISATFSNSVPPGVDRVISNEATPRRVRSRSVLGKVVGAEAKRFQGSVINAEIEHVPHPKYKPENQENITSRTELDHGITIAKFLGGYGDSITFDHVTKLEDRVTIARNLYMHGQVLKSIMIDDDEYDEYRLVVAEGIYRAGPNETMTEGGINDLKSKGRCVVYELRNRKGEIDKKKTYDLAVWWKDSLQFEKMILSYDTYNVGGSLTAQIILIMPEMPSTYITKSTNEIETRFNNYVQSTNELVEVV
jgi:hypothetical protein|tara:strand:+ start:9129 stop:11114 length:1986 start_codon:yes stop_codon:yes gene_type:complete